MMISYSSILLETQTAADPKPDAYQARDDDEGKTAGNYTLRDEDSNDGFEPKEKKGIDTEGEKAALRKQEGDNKTMLQEMDEVNESLKKFVNADFGALVNNRITAAKLTAENEQILTVISKIPKPVKQSTILKQSTEISKKVFDMKELLYHLIPDLRSFVQNFTKSKEHNPAIALLKKLSPVKLRKAGTLDIMKDGTDEEEEEATSEAGENKQMTRIQESDHIIKYFKGDTNKIQDLVIQEIKNETERYFEGRFRVLSLFQLKIFRSSELRHFVDRLEELKEKDISPIENRLELENIETPEIYLVEEKEAMESENHFLTYRASTVLNFLQKLK
jgi:hypothetical protein